MGAGLGLIGSMIAGGAQGFGEAGQAAAMKYGDYLERSTLQEEAGKIQAQRDKTLHDMAVEMETKVRQPFQTGERVAGQIFQRGMETEVRQPFQREQQEAGFAHAESMQDAQQAWQAEQNEAQRSLTREQIASHEKIAAANNSTAIQVARIGGTVQQDKDGNMLWFDKSGKATQIMDPNNPDQPLRGFKDLSPAAKALNDTIKARLVDLDRQEVAAMGDEGALRRIEQQRARLTEQQLNVLTGGISQAGAVATPAHAIPQTAIDALRKDPSKAAEFKQYYGVDPAQYLKQEQKPTTAPQTVTPAAPAAAEKKTGIVGSRVPEGDALQQRTDMAEKLRLKYPPRPVQRTTGPSGRGAANGPSATETTWEESPQVKEFLNQRGFDAMQAKFAELMGTK